MCLIIHHAPGFPVSFPTGTPPSVPTFTTHSFILICVHAHLVVPCPPPFISPRTQPSSSLPPDWFIMTLPHPACGSVYLFYYRTPLNPTHTHGDLLVICLDIVLCIFLCVCLLVPCPSPALVWACSILLAAREERRTWRGALCVHDCCLLLLPAGKHRLPAVTPFTQLPLLAPGAWGHILYYTPLAGSSFPAFTWDYFLFRTGQVCGCLPKPCFTTA